MSVSVLRNMIVQSKPKVSVLCTHREVCFGLSYSMSHLLIHNMCHAFALASSRFSLPANTENVHRNSVLVILYGVLVLEYAYPLVSPNTPSSLISLTSSLTPGVDFTCWGVLCLRHPIFIPRAIFLGLSDWGPISLKCRYRI